MYRLAVFDMDGTILDTLDDITGSLNFALRENGLPGRTKEEARSFVGNGIHKLIERAVPDASDTDAVEKTFDAFNSHYALHCNDKTHPYDGVIELIRDIRARGMLTAVVSNKADYGVQTLCRAYFDGLFDCAVGQREGIRKKPYPDSVFTVLEKLGIRQCDAVYIGDSEVDYETAVNAGMDCISVSWGFRRREILEKLNPGFICDSTDDLARLLIGR